MGSATTSVALIGHVGGRWRLIAHAATPSYVPADDLAAVLLSGIYDADRQILEEVGGRVPFDFPVMAREWPRFVSTTTPPRRLVVLSGSRRQRTRLEAVAARSGWRVEGGSADEIDLIELERMVLSTETQAVLIGADRTPAGDDRRHLPDLVAMVAAATRLRPELMVILAGGAAAYGSVFFDADRDLTPIPQPAPVAPPEISPADNRAHSKETVLSKVSLPDPEPVVADEGELAVSEPEEPAESTEPSEPTDPAEPTAHVEPAGSAEETAIGETEEDAEDPDDERAREAMVAADLPVAHVLLAPDAEAGSPPGSSLQQVLEGLRAEPNDGRLSMARSIASLSYVFDRSIEFVEVGLQGGIMGRSEPFGHGHFSIVSSHASLVEGSFAPANPSEDVIDGLTSWSTQALDRHRLTDRLIDLRVAPWGNTDGDGATFRLAAARAAIARLVTATPEIAERPMPELLIAAGGILTALPASVVALALADIVRRPGTTQIAADPARILGPLGTIEDEGERRKLLASLADDILLPMATLVIPSGLRPGKSAGTLKLKGSAYTSEIELHPGAIQVVDLPTGRSARAELSFRDTVRLGSRGHNFALDVTGGLVGLLLDLRDVPLRISERPESRRAALEAWQKGMWPEVDE